MAVLAVAGFSVLALLSGELLGSVVRGDRDMASVDDDASRRSNGSALATDSASAEPGDANGSADLGESAVGRAPRTFRDGFTLLTQTCASEPAGRLCDDGDTFSPGTVWVLLGFENGEPSDQLAVTVVSAMDEPLGGGELELSEFGCEAPCDGWTYFRLSDLQPGAYRVHVSRNGQPAGSTRFQVDP